MLSLKRYVFTVLLIAIWVVFIACAGNDSPGGPYVPQTNEADPTSSGQDTVYYSSFEDSSDVADWEGYSIISRAADAPEGGGERSAMVSGGCVMPHAFLTLPPTGKDSRVTVKCFGKNLSNGGSVSLRVGDAGPDRISFLVGETDWTVYRSETPLLWPADSPLTIYLSSGGFVSGAMLIDELLIMAR